MGPRSFKNTHTWRRDWKCHTSSHVHCNCIPTSRVVGRSMHPVAAEPACIVACDSCGSHPAGREGSARFVTVLRERQPNSKLLQQTSNFGFPFPSPPSLTPLAPCHSAPRRPPSHSRAPFIRHVRVAATTPSFFTMEMRRVSTGDAVLQPSDSAPIPIVMLSDPGRTPIPSPASAAPTRPRSSWSRAIPMASSVCVPCRGP